MEKITAVVKDCPEGSIWLMTLASVGGVSDIFNTFHAFEINDSRVTVTSIKSTFHWRHNVFECYYHIQLTVKYRKALFDPVMEELVLGIFGGFKERYYIDVFDRSHVHVLCRFLPKYSGGRVIRLMKSITSRILFKEMSMLKKELWGGEFWADGYYISTVSGRGDRRIIEKYIENQGRADDVKQLRLFDT
ncbi:hypothetical protein MNBD_BACTEROID03-1339 [hydrothermal vent metagenome]|uniref:Transposase IS200-like domain-containing protein n=1 Tax=hydrothermal vent metagenome TaxID=652676 RepID=A0A3B0TS32_9ZZZZ